ncbi:MAG TPA: aminotransferase class V-fold PLP-dependent enzyme [Candidatus Dormibacteraeota bacterium]|nr:aminotransferase class V-fold PLP-dependent enzyme [Candidatus Dormibacteraeota bacterium]
MTDPLHDHDHLPVALRQIARDAEAYLAAVDDALVRPPGDPKIDGALPSDGVGSIEALEELAVIADAGATRSTGPRFFHFVMGGVTPAALGADWLTSTLNQAAYNWVSSPLASRIEQVTLGWMKELFGLPQDFSAVMTTAATTANFVGLAAARRWWALQHGVDVDAQGFAGLVAVPVFASGYLHASAVKALGMLGLGRATPRIIAWTDLEADLRRLDGQPAIIIATAGDVNTGYFDPIKDIAALARKHNAWVHVDGAFGLYAAVTPATRHLTEGIADVDSIAVDGHKWLNAPYDTGFAFVRDVDLHAGSFSATAAYLGTETHARPVFGNLAPEMSRRARAIPVWATLRAYGRDGYRAMIERHLALAQRVARQVDEAPDLERLADVPLNIVCFRFHPPGFPESELDDLNRRLGDIVLEDGRIYFGTTVYAGKVAFRPAIVNWRTTEKDVDMIVEVTRELGSQLLARAPGR